MPRVRGGNRLGCDYCAIYPEAENPVGCRKELVAWERGNERHVAERLLREGGAGR